MALDDPAHAGQTDAGALEFFHSVQALKHTEQLVGVLHVEAHTVVTDVDDNFFGTLFGADLDDREFAFAAVFDRVGDQVAQGRPYE